MQHSIRSQKSACRKIHGRKIKKKFAKRFRSMRFLPYSLPCSLYMDSSPQWSISPIASETPDRFRNPCTVSRPRLRFQNMVHRSQKVSVVDYASLVHSSTSSSFICLRLYILLDVLMRVTGLNAHILRRVLYITIFI